MTSLTLIPGKSNKTIKNKYSSVSALDIFNDPETEDEWIIENFILKGDDVMIHAPGGLGKSLFSLYIALALGAADKEKTKLFNRFNIPKVRNTLFIQSENSRKNTRERLHAIIKNQPKYIASLEHIHFMTQENSVRTIGEHLVNKEFQNDVIEFIKNSPAKIDIIVIDPLISFLDCQENDATEMRDNLDGITAIAKTTGVTPIVIHHNKKDSAEYRGSTAIRDWVRNLIGLYPKKNSDTIINVTCEMANNMAEFDSFILTKPKKEMMFKEASIPTTDILEENFEYKKITETLQKNEGIYNGSQAAFVREIKTHFEGAESTIIRHIKTAIDIGLIKCEGSSPYIYTLIKKGN